MCEPRREERRRGFQQGLYWRVALANVTTITVWERRTETGAHKRAVS
jgi:hypothetical protein